ncbi:hypothetical protein GAY28_08360, partial [Azospirillum brasilense]|nr:hypothetical protein [Azospirillum brasilense]
MVQNAGPFPQAPETIMPKPTTPRCRPPVPSPDRSPRPGPARTGTEDDRADPTDAGQGEPVPSDHLQPPV